MATKLILTQNDLAAIFHTSQRAISYNLGIGKYGEVIKTIRGRVSGIDIKVFARYAKRHNIELPDHIKEALESLSPNKNIKGE